MAKNNKKNNKSKKKQVRSLGPVARNLFSRLDAPAQMWKRILCDPCNAPLCHPIYPGGDGGALARFETEFTVGVGATETAGVVVYVPGAAGSTVTGTGPYTIESSGVYAASAINDNTTLTMSAYGDLTPGFGTFTPATGSVAGFLYNNADSIRCVASCMQVMWPGSELNRQGFVSVGQMTGSLVVGAGTSTESRLTAGNVRTLCPIRTKMPDGMVEVKWRPTARDVTWHDPIRAAAAGDLAARSAMVASWSGLPVNTGLRVRLVTVYEYIPRINAGMSVPMGARAMSSNSQDDVLNDLERNAPSWGYNVGRAASIAQSFGGAVITGYAVNQLNQQRIRY